MPRAERRVAGAVLVAALLGAAILQARLALTDESIYWPDEIYKTLEPAHHLAYGYGFLPWEFVRGAVSWALPGMLAGVMRILDFVGVGSPDRYVVLVRCLFIAGALGAAVGTARLSRSQGASPLAAAVAGSAFALSLPILFFSHRALTEVASLAPVAFGLALVLDQRSSPRRQRLGAILLVLAVFVRLQNGVFCIAALITLAARRDRRGERVVGSTLVIGAVAFGLFDLVTWGSPFQSAVEYTRFNVLDRGAEGWGTSSIGYYAEVLGRQMGPALVLVVALALLAAVRSPALFATAFAFLALHSLQPHKEARFILPALPLLFALAGIGCSVAADWLRRLDRRVLPFVPATALLVLGLLPATRYQTLTHADVGQGEIFPPEGSATTNGTAINHLLLAAHQRADLCGLVVRHEMRVWTGGYTYLHRRIPFYGRDNPPADPNAYNYAIDAGRADTPGVVAAYKGIVLIRLRPPPCQADPQFTYRLDSG